VFTSTSVETLSQILIFCRKHRLIWNHKTQELWIVLAKCSLSILPTNPSSKYHVRKQFGADIPNFWHPDCSDLPRRCAAIWWAKLDWASHDLARIPPMVDKTWRNEWLKLKSVKHKIKTLADARINRCDHLAGPAQEVGRLAKSAQFKSVLNCCCTVPVTRSVTSVPCQLSSRTFLNFKVGT
jgi:hypothetical protein